MTAWKEYRIEVITLTRTTRELHDIYHIYAIHKFPFVSIEQTLFPLKFSSYPRRISFRPQSSCLDLPCSGTRIHAIDPKDLKRLTLGFQPSILPEAPHAFEPVKRCQVLGRTAIWEMRGHVPMNPPKPRRNFSRTILLEVNSPPSSDPYSRFQQKTFRLIERIKCLPLITRALGSITQLSLL